MSRAVGRHFQSIQRNRVILDDWRQHEGAIVDASCQKYEERFPLVTADDKAAFRTTTHRNWDTMIAAFHQQMDTAVIRLKRASAVGGVVDISDIAVGHDIRCVVDPTRTQAHLGNQQRARDNLLALDFYDRCGRLPNEGSHVSKLTIPRIPTVDPNAPTVSAVALMKPTYETVVLASFEDTADAMVYRLAVQ